MAWICGKSRCPWSQTCINFGLHWAVLALVFPYARCCLCLSLLSWRSHHRWVSLGTWWSWRLHYLILSALTYPCCTHTTPLSSSLILSCCWRSATFFISSIWIQILCWLDCPSHYELLSKDFLQLFVSWRISRRVHLIISCVCRGFLLLLLLFLL